MPNPSRLPRAALLTLTLLSACAAADPTPPTAQRATPETSGAYLRGRFALDDAELPDAAAAFMSALAADPDSPELRQEAFLAALLADRPEAATLAQGVPDNPTALLVLAGQDALAGRWANAEATFARLPGQGPNEILRPLLVAWSLQGAGRTDDALATLRPFIDGAQNRSLFILHAALIQDVAGRTQDAAPAYAAASRVNGEPNLRLGSILASWEARTGHEADARRIIHTMVEGAPNLAIAEPALQLDAGRVQVGSAADGIAETYLALAAALQNQNATELASLMLHLALAVRPQFTPARLLLSDIQVTSRQFTQASATLAAIPASDALIGVVRLRQANAAARGGRKDEAVRLLEQAAADYPQRPEPLTMLGDLERGNNQFAAAAATYGRAIARIPNPSPADWGLFYAQGMAYERAHDWPKAEADLLHALELSPDEPSVLNYLGYTWAEQGRNLPRAREMLERAVQLRPNDGAIIDSLGWVLLRQGNATDAAHWLERAVELDTEDSSINDHLGDAYWAGGRKAEAQVQWRRALILHPEPDDEAKLHAKLAGNVTPVTVQHAAP